jgi:hypothetical protein
VNEFFNPVHAKHGGSSIWLRRNLASSATIALVADPDRLFEQPGCVLIKDQRKIKVGRVPLQLGTQRMVVYIKRYNVFSLRHRLQSIFARSGAAKSLRGAAILRRAEIPTAAPIAAVEVRRWGVLEKSFYLSEEIAAAKTANAYWCENLRPLAGVAGFRRRRSFLTVLSRLFRRLHRYGIYHDDLKDFNILVRGSEAGGESVFLLDLEGVRRTRYLPRRRRIKNLVQLNRTLGRFLSRTEKLHFLHSYLHNGSSRRRAAPAWVERVLLGSRIADRRSCRKA